MTQDRAADPDHEVELLWREREPRPGLTLDRIVRTAIDLADAEGLEGLSMRKVADRLGFTTMSLYRHVPSRTHLIDLLRDEVLTPRHAEYPDHPHHLQDPEGRTGGDWRARLEEVAREGWELRRRHPWLAEIRGTRHVPGPNAVARYDELLAALTGTALRPSEVIAAANLIGRFLDAEALLLVETRIEERRSGVSEEEWWGARDSLYERLDRYPALTHLWESGGWDTPEDSFEFGLARLLDGIEALVRRRDEIRDETCRECGAPITPADSGRPRVYCSRACRQRAYRKRAT
jgi:AcrR family transcriptional regulator